MVCAWHSKVWCSHGWMPSEDGQLLSNMHDEYSTAAYCLMVIHLLLMSHGYPVMNMLYSMVHERHRRRSALPVMSKSCFYGPDNFHQFILRLVYIFLIFQLRKLNPSFLGAFSLYSYVNWTIVQIHFIVQFIESHSCSKKSILGNQLQIKRTRVRNFYAKTLHKESPWG